MRDLGGTFLFFFFGLLSYPMLLCLRGCCYALPQGEQMSAPEEESQDIFFFFFPTLVF